MKSLIAIAASMIVVFPAIAAEEVAEPDFGDFGRILETLLGSVAHELGDVADHLEPDEPLDRTLSLTVEVSKHDSVSILCATNRFAVESEHHLSAVDAEEDDTQEENKNSLLELTGTVSETNEDGVYLIRYSGKFVTETQAFDESTGGGMEETKETRLEFEGSARFSIGSQLVLAQKGDQHITLIVEEAE